MQRLQMHQPIVNAALADDFVDAAWRHAQILGQPILTQIQGVEELLQ